MKIHQAGEWNNNGARFQQRHVGPAQGHRGKLRPHEMHTGHAHADKNTHVGERRDV